MGHEDGARSLHLRDTDDQPDLLTINVAAREVRAPTTHKRTACCTLSSSVSNVEPDPEERARAFLFGIEVALLVGTKHYHPKTHELLTTPKQIIECLLAETEVITERDPCVPSPLVRTTS